MKSINKVILIGALGKDPDVRATASGLAVASFSLATSRKQKDKTDVTQWHNCVAFGKTAELVESYLKKGSKLYLEGELQYQEYEKDGIKRVSTKIVINDMSFLSDSGNPSSGKQKAHCSDSPGEAMHGLYEDLDDSIPF